MGIQTMGGIFTRTMKITSNEETKLTELYSSASRELSKESKSASKVEMSASGRTGLFLGAK